MKTAAWPATVAALEAAQETIATRVSSPWSPGPEPLTIGGCFVCFDRDATVEGGAPVAAWAAASLVREGASSLSVTVSGRTEQAYRPGLLALRSGALLEAAVRALPRSPDVLLVNATGRDHPRGAGLALHLGAVLDLPSVGVTHRPLVARGAWPAETRGSRSPLTIEGRETGYWLRTREGTRPLAVHAAWRTSAEVAAVVVLRASGAARTPEPLRIARREARLARSRASSRATSQ